MSKLKHKNPNVRKRIYKIGNKTAIVDCVFKENGEHINEILVRLMQAEIEKKPIIIFCKGKSNMV